MTFALALRGTCGQLAQCQTAYDRLAVTATTTRSGEPRAESGTVALQAWAGSIVELSQAQLQQTQAQISNVGAGYDYRLALAILKYQTTGI